MFNRFEIEGYLEKDGVKYYTKVAHAEERPIAFARAKVIIGPRKFHGAIVHDTMGKIGFTDIWDIDISGRDYPIHNREG